MDEVTNKPSCHKGKRVMGRRRRKGEGEDEAGNAARAVTGGMETCERVRIWRMRGKLGIQRRIRIFIIVIRPE